MSPEYLEELADIADPDHLWQLGFSELMNLPAHQRQQLDAGIALRRHASHIKRLRELLTEGRSLLITPLSENGVAVKAVATPPDHAKLREAREGASK